MAEGVIFSTGHVAVVMGDDVKTPLGATGVLSWPSIEHLEHEIEDWPYDLSVHGEPFEE